MSSLSMGMTILIRLNRILLDWLMRLEISKSYKIKVLMSWYIRLKTKPRWQNIVIFRCIRLNWCIERPVQLQQYLQCLICAIDWNKFQRTKFLIVKLLRKILQKIWHNRDKVKRIWFITTTISKKTEMHPVKKL